MSVQIELIKMLRERTGAGLSDCKKALDTCNNDLDKACDWLRTQGIAKSAKKANRIAAEGISDFYIEGDLAVIVEVNCETDFVAKGDKFKNLVNSIKETIVKKQINSLEAANKEFEPLFADATVAIGEKLTLRRFELIKKNPLECFGAYKHMGGKITSLVVINKNDVDFANDMATHITACNPLYICPHCVPKEVFDHERQIALEASKNDENLMKKPQAIIEKIIEGKVNKSISESILHQQLYTFEEDKKVEQVLKEKGIAVLKFVRYAVGEGIEKKSDDFAKEVMDQIK